VSQDAAAATEGGSRALQDGATATQAPGCSRGWPTSRSGDTATSAEDRAQKRSGDTASSAEDGALQNCATAAEAQGKTSASHGAGIAQRGPTPESHRQGWRQESSKLLPTPQQPCSDVGSSQAAATAVCPAQDNDAGGNTWTTTFC